MDEIFGNLFMAAVVFGLACFIPAILVLSFAILVIAEIKTPAQRNTKIPRRIHTITSILYAGIALFNFQLILWDLVVNNGSLVVALLWAMGSIIISRVLINKGNTLIAYLVLLSAPVVAWFFYSRLFN
jgi:hypothetical protein